jgi:hypothetical protein
MASSFLWAGGLNTAQVGPLLRLSQDWNKGAMQMTSSRAQDLLLSSFGYGRILFLNVTGLKFLLFWLSVTWGMLSDPRRNLWVQAISTSQKWFFLLQILI